MARSDSVTKRKGDLSALDVSDIYGQQAQAREAAAGAAVKEPKNLFGRKATGKNVVEAAYDRVRHTFDLYDHVAVGFSGGKDSTVCLNIAYDVAKERGRLPLHVVHWDEEAIPYEVEDYVRRVYNRDGINLDWFTIPVEHRNACSPSSPFWYCWAPEDAEKWVRQKPPEGRDLETFPVWPVEARLSVPKTTKLVFPVEQYRGSVGLIMGIRGQESLTRMRAVVKRREDNYIIRGDDKEYDKVYPIYDWRHEDIWTAMRVFDWDYCEAYDVMEMAGVSLNDSRVAPPYGEQPLLGLWQYRVAFPDIWHRMVDRVPGVNTAGMYARTELYNIGQRAQKPPDISWQEFIAQNVKRFPESVQPTVVDNLKEWIFNHYKQTRDPILPFSFHPYTAMSWEFLMGMSMKGDFKHRMSPKYEKDPEAVRSRVLAYVTEFYTMKWQGRLWEIELDDSAELDLPDWVHEALGPLIRGEVTL